MHDGPWMVVHNSCCSEPLFPVGQWSLPFHFVIYILHFVPRDNCWLRGFGEWSLFKESLCYCHSTNITKRLLTLQICLQKSGGSRLARFLTITHTPGCTAMIRQWYAMLHKNEIAVLAGILISFAPVNPTPWQSRKVHTVHPSGNLAVRMRKIISCVHLRSTV